jgi:CBS domain
LIWWGNGGIHGNRKGHSGGQGERSHKRGSGRDFVRKIIIKGRTMDMDTTLSDCMNLMTEKRVRHLPVLEGGKPVGIGQLERYTTGIL